MLVIIDGVREGGWLLALGILYIAIAGFSAYMAHRRVWEGLLLGAVLGPIGPVVEWVLIAVQWRNRPTRS